MIEITEVSKSYKKIRALQNVSLVVQPGAVTGVVGPNGCGKTTLIKAVLGLVIPDSGSIRVCGQVVDAKGTHRERIGYLPQNPDFPANLKVRELFRMVEDIRGCSANRLDELIEMFDMKRLLARHLGVLSGGMKQKVATTLAFMFDSPVLVLDEPSVGLDPIASVKLKSLLESEVKRGKTILLVSHVMSEAEQLMSAMAFLLEGNIEYFGKVKELQREAGTSTLESALIYLMSGKAVHEVAVRV